MGTITTERTSKPLKLHLALSIFLACFAGLGVFTFQDRDGSIADWTVYLFLAAFTWYVITKVRIWWNHE
ncbi:hypothetical protein FV139_17650 [Parahaliea maris]|uniref:Uncharacterized protein n=1 Tax=Parahaliea maris TaxID=2716870 RepID=A0A5C8ZSR0_9GAMM|nr:hypothetical protein [Parahaliea maris]TXS90799.1 hypothetical protein FV139_17650 [Parahaliea maris]